jgi:hypothetical protein
MRFLLLPLLAACIGGEAPPPPPVVAPPKPPPPKVVEDTGGPVKPNRPPQLGQVFFEPKSPTTLDAVRAVAKASDADGDSIDIDYQWFVNDRERYDVRGEVLPARMTKKGDVVKVTLTVSDGSKEAERSSRDLTIGNATPRFVADPRSLREIDGFRVEAVDDDDDKLKYSLEGEPDGMTVDPDIGVLRYKGSVDEPGGKYTITVRARDPDGARAGWTFGIELSPGSGAVKKAKAADKAADGDGAGKDGAAAEPKKKERRW